MKLYTVGILGATGAVGQEMMRILEERDFPVGKLVPLASARSVGKTVKFKGQDVAIELACDEAVLRTLDSSRRLAYGKTLVDMIAPGHSPSGIFCTATTMDMNINKSGKKITSVCLYNFI